MKMYLILLVFAGSITAQKSPLVAVKHLSPGITFGSFNMTIVQEQASHSKDEGRRGNARLDGVVRDRFQRREPIPNALVRLFPDPPNLEHRDLIRSARTDELGNFEIDNVVPGRYRIIAIQGEGPENLQNEATIAASAGTRVELSDKQSRTLTLYLYPAHR